MRATMAPRSGRARNVILFVGDGMSPTTVTAARILAGQRAGGSGEEHQLAFEKLPYLALSQISATLVILAAMALFDLPMRGDWLSLQVVVAVFLVGALGTGLLVSTLTDSQQMAFQAAADKAIAWSTAEHLKREAEIGRASV